MRRSSWLKKMGPKSNDKCPYKRKAEGDLRQRRRQCDHSDGGCSHKSRNAKSHQKLQEANNRFFRQAPRGSVALWDFGLLASRTVKEHISVVLSYQVCGMVLWQP